MASAPNQPFLGADLDERAHRSPRPGPFVASSLIALTLVAGLAGAVVKVLVDDRSTSLHAGLSARMDALARGRAEVLTTWLDGIAQAGRRLTESDLLRLFASEMALSAPGGALAHPLAEQLPYFQQLLDDFVQQNGLVAAQLVGLDGRGYLRSTGTLAMQGGPAPEIDPKAERGVSPIRAGDIDDATILGGRLLLDVALPVPIAQPLHDGNPEVAAVLTMTVPVADQLNSLLDAGPLLGIGERFRLIQRGVGGVEQVIAGPDPRIVPFAAGGLVPGESRPYGRLIKADGAEALVVGAAVGDLPWTVLDEIDSAAALAPLRTFTTTALVLAGLIGLALVLAFVAFWWRRAGAHQRELALQYRDLAAGIQRQRQLLESITNAMQEMLCLKTPEGRYAFVNPAFAHALGRPVDAILGRTDLELFGADFAAHQVASDRRALDGEAVIAESSEACLRGRSRHLAASKARVCDEVGEVIGMVAVTRDETELVEQRRKHEHLIRQTVDALIRAIELRDPFLLGHSRRLQRYAVAVGRGLGLDARDLETIDLAACLSQVGKIFIPQAILTKPGRLDEAETRIMRSHVEHALEVVGPIDFELPIRDAIGQMYERLDGSGYPKGLRGGQIGRFARILAAIDVFCALTEPRAYRGRTSAGKALLQLAESPQRYDVKVVSALAEAVAAEGAGSPDGGGADVLAETSAVAPGAPAPPNEAAA